MGFCGILESRPKLSGFGEARDGFGNPFDGANLDLAVAEYFPEIAVFYKYRFDRSQIVFSETRGVQSAFYDDALVRNDEFRGFLFEELRDESGQECSYAKIHNPVHGRLEQDFFIFHQVATYILPHDRSPFQSVYTFLDRA